MDGCTFCTLEHGMAETMVGCLEFTLHEDRTLVIDDTYSDGAGWCATINYCPMCGRKLEEK